MVSIKTFVNIKKNNKFYRIILCYLTENNIQLSYSQNERGKRLKTYEGSRHV